MSYSPFTVRDFTEPTQGLTSNVFPVSGGKVQGLPQPMGISYAVLTTSSNNTQVSDDNIVAGELPWWGPKRSD